MNGPGPWFDDPAYSWVRIRERILARQDRELADRHRAFDEAAPERAKQLRRDNERNTRCP